MTQQQHPPSHRQGRGRRIVFPASNEVTLEEFEAGRPDTSDVCLRTLCSLISTGTEMTVLRGAFEPGSHWEEYAQYPFQPGYTAVAEIEAVGAAVPVTRLGTRVLARIPHTSHAVVDLAACFQIPDAIATELAPWATLAQVAYVGAAAAEHRLRDSVLIIGAGPIGQMSVRWAVAAGAESVMVADIAPQRLALAVRGGATSVIDGDPGERADAIAAANFDEPPRVVIDTTGRPEMLATALRLVRDHGTVVLLGDAARPSQQHITKDVITRGLQIRGAHGMHGLDVEVETYRHFFSLVASGRFSLDGLNTHRFSPEQCAEAYRLAETQRTETMGILFEWDF